MQAPLIAQQQGLGSRVRTQRSPLAISAAVTKTNKRRARDTIGLLQRRPRHGRFSNDFAVKFTRSKPL